MTACRREPLPRLGAFCAVTVLMLGVSVLGARPSLVESVSASTQDATAPVVHNSTPIWSPNSGYILFLSTRLAKIEISLMKADGSEQRRLTTTPTGDSLSPAWSPDSERIVYSSGVRIRALIYVMNRDGTNQRRLTSEGKYDALSWSADGRRIGYLSGDDLYLMDADGSQVVRVTSDQSVRSYTWSPDGQRIVLGTYKYIPGGVTVLEQGGVRIIIIVGPGGSAYTLDVIDPNGTGRRTLSGSRDKLPKWSPNGRRIAFVSDRDGSQQIYTMNPDGSGVIRLTSEGENTEPVWSPDSQRIAFVSSRQRSSQIHVINADGSVEVQLTRTGQNANPSWSPDGRRIAFSSGRGGALASTQIFVINLDSNVETQLTTEQGP